jgi:hypothetical protein
MRFRLDALVSLPSEGQNPWYQARSQTMNTAGAVSSSADACIQYLHLRAEYTVAQLVEALCYKPEGRGFDFR